MTTRRPDAAVRIRMYETMIRILHTDERIRGLLMQGTIAVTYYSARGHEAIPAAMSAALRADDYVATYYRGMHDTIAKGAPLPAVVSEIFGKAAGTCKGKGGIMHLTDPGSGVMVTSGIVGGQIPIAVGLALGSRLRGEDRVTAVSFGDGATNIGAFHESMNMAALWSLPLVFVCQNNEYGEFTPRMESMTIHKISDRADSYAMAGVTVDGNDPDEIYAVAVDAVERARRGDGPTLIEALTYRFMGHIFGLDTMPYIPAEEMAARLAADPIPAYRARLVNEGVLSEDAMQELEERVRAEVDDAVQFALDAPDPDHEESLTDVYAKVVA